MPKSRDSARKTRVRLSGSTDVTVRSSQTPFSQVGNDHVRVADHLQGAKENYELSMVAEEVQRLKSQKAIEVMADQYQVTTDAVRFGHEVTRQQVDEIKRQVNDADVQEHTLDELKEVRDIYHNFLSDNLEALGRSVVDIASSDPRTQPVAPYEEEIDLSPLERLTGKAKRTRK